MNGFEDLSLKVSLIVAISVYEQFNLMLCN